MTLLQTVKQLIERAWENGFYPKVIVLETPAAKRMLVKEAGAAEIVVGWNLGESPQEAYDHARSRTNYIQLLQTPYGDVRLDVGRRSRNYCQWCGSYRRFWYETCKQCGGPN